MLGAMVTPAGSISLIAMLALGFFLGMRHATDADHVVAVSTIVSREKRIGSAALIGAMWGMGHTLTILGVGTGIILFTLVIPPRLGLSMEFSVGLMLIVLGVVNLRGFGQHLHGAPAFEADRGEDGNAEAPTLRPHVHSWRFFSPSPSSVHADSAPSAQRFGRWPLYQWIRPLVVGLVHGLAGSAAVALLVLTTLRNTRWAVAYLAVFGVGTIAGMMVITVAMASALRFAGERSAWINRRLAVATGVLSVAFGMLIVYQMGFAHGLFTQHPIWTPE